MPPKTSQAVERYRTLGLAIEAAIVLDNWTEVETLIDERDGLLSGFANGQMILNPLAKQQMKACDHRLLQFLMHAKSQTAAEFRQIRESAFARRAYQQVGGGTAALDKAG